MQQMQQGNIDSHCFRQKSTRDRISRSVECEINLCERHTLNHSLSRLLNFSPAVRKPGGIYFTPADLSKLVAVFKRYEGTWRGPKLSSGPLPMTGCSKFHHSFLVPYETYWVFSCVNTKGGSIAIIPSTLGIIMNVDGWRIIIHWRRVRTTTYTLVHLCSGGIQSVCGCSLMFAYAGFVRQRIGSIRLD